MNYKKHVYQFLLRNGISFVLMFMLVGIIYLLETIEIKNRLEVDIFNEGNLRYKAYIHKNEKYYPQVGTIVYIDTTDKSLLSFKIIKINEEFSYYVLQLKLNSSLSIKKEATLENSKTSGFIYINKIKLRELIFEKWKQK